MRLGALRLSGAVLSARRFALAFPKGARLARAFGAPAALLGTQHLGRDALATSRLSMVFGCFWLERSSEAMPSACFEWLARLFRLGTQYLLRCFKWFRSILGASPAVFTLPSRPDFCHCRPRDAGYEVGAVQLLAPGLRS